MIAEPPLDGGQLTNLTELISPRGQASPPGPVRDRALETAIATLDRIARS